MANPSSPNEEVESLRHDHGTIRARRCSFCRKNVLCFVVICIGTVLLRITLPAIRSQNNQSSTKSLTPIKGSANATIVKNPPLDPFSESPTSQALITYSPNLDPTSPALPIGNPTIGTNYTVLVLLLRFTDHANRTLPDPKVYDILWNTRIREWFEENSNGRYNAHFEVQPWEDSDNTEIHYSFGQYGRTPKFQKSFQPILDQLDHTPGFDWSRYDIDSDGYLDNLVVIHSGYGAEEGGLDCTNDRLSYNRIWSHALVDPGNMGWTSADGQVAVQAYSVASGLDLTCDSRVENMGVMIHEYIHTFRNAPIDLYDFQHIGFGVGHFDIMGYPWGVDHDGSQPPGLSSWSKTRLGWVECLSVSHSNSPVEYMLRPKECAKIPLLNGGEHEEYLLLENRQHMMLEGASDVSGMVIYHIDDAAEDQLYAGYPGQEDWPENGNHYRVAVLQADGNYDLETGINLGDEGDVWFPGMVLTPNYDGSTYPNTDSYQQGIITPTEITIEVRAGDGSSSSIDFRVDFST